MNGNGEQGVQSCAAAKRGWFCVECCSAVAGGRARCNVCLWSGMLQCATPDDAVWQPPPKPVDVPCEMCGDDNDPGPISGPMDEDLLDCPECDRLGYRDDCELCHGLGAIDKDTCSACDGRGTVRITHP